MPLSPVARHPIVLVLLASLALSGCGAGPDIRVNEEAASKVSLGEGKRLLEAGRAVEAVTAFRRQLRVEGADLQALNGLAIAYSELGRMDLAAEMFSRALALSPDDPATLNNIGFSALRRADERLARHYLEKARRENGDHEKIGGNLARLALLEEMNRMDPAKPVLTPAMMSKQDLRSSEVMRISLPRRGAQIRSASPTLEIRQPTSLPRSMIDFTAVTDPFSRPLAIK